MREPFKKKNYLQTLTSYHTHTSINISYPIILFTSYNMKYDTLTHTLSYKLNFLRI